MSFAVILVAAGRGRRFGGDIPKQYVPIAGQTSFTRCIETFLSQSQIGWIQPVIHADDAALFEQERAGFDAPELLPPVTGGDSRAASVRAGLDALAAHAPEHVLIHDAARPFISAEVIARVCDALTTHDAAFAALPVVDALWSCTEGLASHPVPRDGLWRAQTPQGFRYKVICAAHDQLHADATDDVAAAHLMSVQAKAVLGDPENFKVTTAEDLDRAQRTARQISAR